MAVPSGCEQPVVYDTPFVPVEPDRCLQGKSMHLLSPRRRLLGHGDDTHGTYNLPIGVIFYRRVGEIFLVY